jgi:hypothetical protein
MISIACRFRRRVQAACLVDIANDGRFPQLALSRNVPSSRYLLTDISATRKIVIEVSARTLVRVTSVGLLQRNKRSRECPLKGDEEGAGVPESRRRRTTRRKRRMTARHIDYGALVSIAWRTPFATMVCFLFPVRACALITLPRKYISSQPYACLKQHYGPCQRHLFFSPQSHGLLSWRVPDNKTCASSKAQCLGPDTLCNTSYAYKPHQVTVRARPSCRLPSLLSLIQGTARQQCWSQGLQLKKPDSLGNRYFSGWASPLIPTTPRSFSWRYIPWRANLNQLRLLPPSPNFALLCRLARASRRCLIFC